MKVWAHFKTVMHHKKLVRQGCFQVGLYRQGIFHDLSKFSPTEFLVGCKYFQGDRSPNNAEREEKGLSYSWLHHKGRNKHHMEYWIDFGLGTEHAMIGMKMPTKYVVEMFFDRVAASKTYQKEAYTPESPWMYYVKGQKFHVIHPESKQLLEEMLLMLKDKGEEETCRYIKKEILGKRG
jgi:hypothetical protein